MPMVRLRREAGLGGNRNFAFRVTRSQMPVVRLRRSGKDEEDEDEGEDEGVGEEEGEGEEENESPFRYALNKFKLISP